MSIIDKICERRDKVKPFLIDGYNSLNINDLLKLKITKELSTIKNGDVVALIGDFDLQTIKYLFYLIDKNTIIMPLTLDTKHQHQYFFENGFVDVVIYKDSIKRIRDEQVQNPLINSLRSLGHAGLILFSSGTTGKPKAILHDFSNFIKRYDIPRSALRTINFLLFDHIGGINTFFHMMFNNGVVIKPSSHSVESIINDIQNYNIELLPTTPTFLRLLLLSGLLETIKLPSLKMITYGTERMDLPTLKALTTMLPEVNFRQTYGMSELGILRIRTKKKDDLWISIGGEGVETKIKDNGELLILSPNRMLGYLNAPTPFDSRGWYPTKDLVEEDGEWIKLVGRLDDIINVGGIKVMPSDIESIALQYPNIIFAKVIGRRNPITGMHVELFIQISSNNFEIEKFKSYLKNNLTSYTMPQKITIGNININHRWKKS